MFFLPTEILPESYFLPTSSSKDRALVSFLFSIFTRFVDDLPSNISSLEMTKKKKYAIRFKRNSKSKFRVIKRIVPYKKKLRNHITMH